MILTILIKAILAYIFFGLIYILLFNSFLKTIADLMDKELLYKIEISDEDKTRVYKNFFETKPGFFWLYYRLFHRIYSPIMMVYCFRAFLNRINS